MPQGQQHTFSQPSPAWLVPWQPSSPASPALLQLLLPLFPPLSCPFPHVAWMDNLQALCSASRKSHLPFSSCSILYNTKALARLFTTKKPWLSGKSYLCG